MNLILWARRIALATLVGFASAFSAEIPDGGTIQHARVDDPNTFVTLRKFNGKYTAMNISQTALDIVGMARVRKAIDEQDILYEAYKNWLGGEPSGEGLHQISVYEETVCPYACVQMGGTKGIDVSLEQFLDPSYGHVIIHEFAHTFDFWSPMLFVGPEGKAGHDWTFFAEHHIEAALGMSENGLNATDYYNYKVRWFHEPVEQYTGDVYGQCIQATNCTIGAYHPELVRDMAQSGVVLRIQQLYGSVAMSTWPAKVRALITERGLPATDQDRSALLIESLSRTVGMDLSCFFDSWRWPMSSALRGRLALIGSNSYCVDADGDGFSRFKYDCNDANAAINPGRAETVNGADDDCDRIVDENAVVETSEFPDFQANALPIALPADIRGGAPSFSSNTWDCFRFSMSADGPIQTTIKSKSSFKGSIIIRQSQATWDFDGAEIQPSMINTFKTHLTAGNWDACVIVNQDGDPEARGGEYEVSIQKSYAYPMEGPTIPMTFTPQPATASAIGQISFPIPAIPTRLAGQPSLTTHFWVSGFGNIGSVASASTAPFIWTPPAGTKVLAPTYRVMYKSGITQVQAWSQHQSLLGSANWASLDIGSPSTGIFTRFGEQELSVTSTGADIWGTADGFRFTYLPLTGNGEVIARVHNLALTHASVKGGVMIRETLAPNSKNAFVGLQGSNQATFQNRAVAGGNTLNLKMPAAAPLWVRLTRSGNVFTASTSVDGLTWSPLGNPTTIPMAASLFAGVALTSHTLAASTLGGFSHVAVTATNLSLSGKVANSSGVAVAGVTLTLSGSKSATATSDASGNYSFTGLRQGDSYTVTPSKAGTTFTPAKRGFPVLKTSTTGDFTGNPLPAPWVSLDIGSVGVEGSAANVSGTYTVKGSGTDIFGSADAFRFVYFPVTGDAKLTVRVSAVQNTNEWAKSGVMIRENLTSGSKNAFMAVSAAKGATFQRRTSAGASTTSTVQAGTVPRWLRITRVGTLFSGFHSTDGVTWTLVASQSISMTASVYVGIAVTSHSNSVLCTSTIGNVSTN